MLKAVREAKVHTSWLSPDSGYEAALTAFVDAILDSSKPNYFLEDFLQFEKQIAYYGALNSLSQVLLKITSPGVPDFYQGMELWDFSLVDPDNRRPVDFRKRVKLLDDLTQEELQGQNSLVKQILKSWHDGRVKLYVTYKALDMRRADKNVFQQGSYVPLQAEGQRQEHICAFARGRGDKWALIVVPRLVSKLVDTGTSPVGQRVWGNDMLLLSEDMPQDWLNVLTGENLKVSDRPKRLYLSEIFRIFPVSLLRSIRS
jgi:(1->4)-alpha-D-glucan 1-alpha-D-glucosylmutase